MIASSQTLYLLFVPCFGWQRPRFFLPIATASGPAHGCGSLECCLGPYRCSQYGTRSWRPPEANSSLNAPGVGWHLAAGTADPLQSLQFVGIWKVSSVDRSSRRCGAAIVMASTSTVRRYG